MTEATWHEHDSIAALVAAVSDAVGRIIGGAIDARGAALLALPGGSTPKPVFAQLARVRLPWDKVTIIPTDERLVEPDDKRSNVALLQSKFAATGARVLPLAGADATLQALQWPLDLIWLGMGADGHTASIFAGPDLETALADNLRSVRVLPDPLPPEAPVARVTLTRSAIVAARAILVTITGEAKRALLKRALADGAESSSPIGRVLAGAAPPIAIHWCAA